MQSDILPLRQVVVKTANEAFISSERIASQWQDLNFVNPPDFAEAQREYDAFLSLFADREIEVVGLPRDDGTTMDSLYPRDATVVFSGGLILCNMGKAARHSEPEAQASFLRDMGIPIAGRIEHPGRLEGGDVAWLDERTVAVGRGYRTNDEGIRQLTLLLGDSVDTVIPVALPHWHGADDVFHLMSVFSPVDENLAAVYSPLMPVQFRESLLTRGFELVEVPEQEFASLGCNVLALAPRSCVMVEGNPVTRARLEAAGAEVRTFPGNHICVPGGGGPTCLTRPLSRTNG